jgi:hypothetical protein
VDTDLSCPGCGGRLVSGAAWCGQCFRPVASRTPAPAGPPLNLRAPQAKAPALEVEYSRLRGGPTSFGWAGRTAASIVLFFLAWCVYVYAFPVLLGVTDRRFLILYLVFAVPVVVVLLRKLWRPTRIV